MKKPTDLHGTEIEAGDTIAYALLTGRSATMATYEVLEVLVCGTLLVQQQTRGYAWSGPNAKPSRLKCPNNRALVLSKKGER